MPPCISLLLPVYNGERFVEQSIRSILNQDYVDLELIITDNASIDRTERICREFVTCDDRVRYVRNKGNLGAAKNFNLALELSSGKYIKWCAHDDMISSNYVSACVNALEKNSDAVLAYGTTQVIDEDGASLATRRLSRPNDDLDDAARRFYGILSKSAEELFLYGDGEIFGIFRAEALPAENAHRPYYGSDRSLLAEMALRGRFIHVPDAVFYNRDHRWRSSLLPDPREREKWIRGSDARGRGLSIFPTLAHLLEIAWRNRGAVPLRKTFIYISAWFLRRDILVRFLSEGVGVLSPSVRSVLGMGIRKVGNKLRTPPATDR